jgi:hypothetical protein
MIAGLDSCFVIFAFVQISCFVLDVSVTLSLTILRLPLDCLTHVSSLFSVLFRTQICYL